MTHFETIQDSELDQVAGGLSFDIGLTTGIKVESELGSISIPSPITVASDLIGGVTSRLGDFLTRFGNKLTELGQLFDFS